ncbi:MAG: right-handed parallel beta-helix repeat-containing protein [Hydrogenophilaceae bacterium]|nr:right-handed parallel beta-helix repeat-containing protein [Hydrogenophilaceae bacterium]
MHAPSVISFLSILLAGQVNLAVAGDYPAGPEDYRSVITRLEPGDRLLLKPGDYHNGLPLHGIQGRANRPIVVEGPATGERARFLARPGANTVSLVNVQHIVIRNLELDGRNLPVDAVKAEGHAQFAHHVTLENLHITGHGNNQLTVGISTKCPARGWIIRGNVIEGAGTGIYLGDSDGSDPFWEGLIENNWVLDSVGYNLQIKHQKGRPAENAEGLMPAVTMIRNNFFRKAANSSTEKRARPNVLLGHWPLQGAGSDDRYLVYGNVFLNNPTEALFQAEGRVVLYNNMFINPFGDAINIQPHNDIPRDMEVFYNTVLASGTGIRVSEPSMADEGFTQRITGNIISATNPLQARNAEENLLMTYQHDLAGPERIHDLSTSLIKRGRNQKDLPGRLIQIYRAYPEWDRIGAEKRRNVSTPGAMISREMIDRFFRENEKIPRTR